MEYGANANLKNNDGWTILMETASFNRNIECSYTLIKNGASVNLVNEDGDSALMLALKYNNPCLEEIVMLLLENGADVNIINNNNETALYIALQKQYSSSITKILLEHGAKLSRRKFGQSGISDWSPLMLAIYESYDTVILEIC